MEAGAGQHQDPQLLLLLLPLLLLPLMQRHTPSTQSCLQDLLILRTLRLSLSLSPLILLSGGS